MWREAGRARPRLVALSLLLAYGLGLLVGIIQAARSRSRLDTTLSVVSVTLFALPGFWLGLMFIMLFTYWLRVLPAFGAAGMDADVLTGWPWVVDQLRHLTLRLLTLTVIGVGGMARFARGAMLDVITQPFVAAARAKIGRASCRERV